MKNERHNCGGILRNKQVTVTKNIGKFFYTFTVEGKQCTKCKEEVISRDTLRELESLPVKPDCVHRRKAGTLFTVDTPSIHGTTAGSILASTRPIPTKDTGQLAHV